MKSRSHILFAISVDDYHELDEFADAIKLPKRVKVKAVEAAETGNNGQYWGVLYTGRKPSKADITKTLIDAGYQQSEDI